MILEDVIGRSLFQRLHGCFFADGDRKSTRLNSSHTVTSYAVFCLKKKIGAAVTGLRPVLEIMFGDFLGLSMDSLINQATKYWFLSGERQSGPIVIRSVVGAGGRFG